MATMSVVNPNAKIGKNVTISPFCVIGGDVIIGDNSWIGPGVSIMDGVRIGANCKIYQGAILGSVPQDLKYEGEESILEISDNVIIREYCTINRGTKANYKTFIGKNTLIMAYVHVAHDCIISHNCILSNNVNLAGHIELAPYVIIGGMSAVHQFVHIGIHSFIGGGSLVRKDVPPYVKAAREPLSYVGINAVGLRRRGFDSKQIKTIQDIYRVLFVKGYNTNQALKHIHDNFETSDEKSTILEFIQQANRGLMRGFSRMKA